MSTSAPSWAAWLTQRMSDLGYATNSDLARAAGVPDSVISRWRNNGTMPSLGQLRRLTEPLGASLLQLLVAAGHLTPDEAEATGAPEPIRIVRSVREAIAHDPELDDELRQLLLVQYEAMLTVARARSGDSRTRRPLRR